MQKNEMLNAIQEKMRGRQYPGLQRNLTNLTEIKEVMETVKSVNGFKITLAANGITEYTQIKLPGTARHQLGIKFLAAYDDQATRPRADIEFSFALNNERIVDDVNLLFYTSNVENLTCEEYNKLERPLNGTDQYILTFNNPGDAIDIYIAVYWI